MVDNYKIISVLGKGGMSVVYLAEHVQWHTKWAVKQVHKNVWDHFDVLAEPNILKALSHPMLPHVVDIYEDETDVYIVEEYIEGTDLARYLKENGPADEKTMVRWLRDLCDVLIYLHEQKPAPIIYRDLKPSNIMLCADGSIRLIDFGIARKYKKNSQADTTAAGTRGYASPEQIFGGAQTDIRSDLYSLGVSAWHLLTGKGPSSPPYEILPVRQVRPEVSDGLEYIIWKCTQRDPDLRYSSAREILNDLDNMEKLKIVTEQEKQKRRKKTGIIILAAAAAVILAVGGTAWYQKIRAERAAYAEELRQKEEAAEAAALQKQKEEAYTAGIQAMEAGDYEAAREHFQDALSADADYGQAVIGMGDALTGLAGRSGDPAQAEQLFDEAEKYYTSAAEAGEKTAEERKEALDEAVRNYHYQQEYSVMAEEFYAAFKKHDMSTIHSLYTGAKYADLLDRIMMEIGSDERNRYVYLPDNETKSLVFCCYKVLYYGDYVSGQRSGTGILYLGGTFQGESHCRYEGVWADDLPNGKGTEYTEAFRDENGDGESDLPVLQSEGEFKDGLYDGRFTVSWIMKDGTVVSTASARFREGVSVRLTQEQLVQLLQPYYSAEEAKALAEETDLNNPNEKVIGVTEAEDGPSLMMEEIKNGVETIHQVIGISTEEGP